jgi:short-subunit dehydrogenase
VTASGSFAERYGPWAVVTGAAAGMGAAFAADLRGRGVSILLVDRDAAGLEQQAGPDDATLVLDLAAPDAADALLDATRDLDMGLLVSNAALSCTGPFLDQDLDSALTQLRLNCELPLRLVHALLPGLVARGRGGVLLVSSLSAMRGTPLEAGYAATKAWTMILAESLWDELREHGVDVMALLPGTTNTPGFQRARPQPGLGMSNVMEPSEVVREALDALGTRPSVIAGQANRDSEAFMASLDRVDAVTTMGKVMREMFPYF